MSDVEVSQDQLDREERGNSMKDIENGMKIKGENIMTNGINHPQNLKNKYTLNFLKKEDI